MTFAREGADIVFCDIVSYLEEVDYPLATPADTNQAVRAVESLAGAASRSPPTSVTSKPCNGWWRIVLQVDDPDTLGVASAADSAVGVYFPSADGQAEGRNYSVRYHEGDRIALDIVLHTYGPGTKWASTARPGDRVGLDHARS